MTPIPSLMREFWQAHSYYDLLLPSEYAILQTICADIIADVCLFNLWGE